MGKSKIEWCHNVWNPIRGCSRVSAGCQQCYAERQAHRFSGKGGPYEGLTKMTSHGPVWTGKIRTVPEALEQPLHWTKPQRIFVNSMSDLFHEDVPVDFIDRVFTTIRRCEVLGRGHTFQVLTKRPQRMLGFMRQIPVPKNLWLGVSVEDQDTADERIPLLLQTPAAVRFLSCEPLLGPVDIQAAMNAHMPRTGPVGDVPPFSVVVEGRPIREHLHWVITGGESGPKARPTHPEWVRSLRDQCSATGVAFFMKQWGEWLPICMTPAVNPNPGEDWHKGRPSVVLQLSGEHEFAFPPGAMTCIRMGKKAAGRELDGRTHDEYPAAAN